jgi:hypothetical protein
MNEESSRTAGARSERASAVALEPTIPPDGSVELFCSDDHPTSIRLSVPPRLPEDDGVYRFVELGVILNSYHGLAFASFCAGALGWAGLTAAFEGFVSGTTTVAVATVGLVLAITAGLFCLGAHIRSQHCLLEATPTGDSAGAAATDPSVTSTDSDTDRTDR